MNRYAQLSGPDANGVYVVSPNIIESATDPDAELGAWVLCGNAGPGFTTLDKVTFYPPPPVSNVPESITMRQARLVLFTAGLIGSVQAAIDSLPSPEKEKAQIEWDFSNEVQRHNGFVSTLGPALGLTEEQIDALFVTGATL
ncbi:MAG: hypothetical protein V4706_01660 [Pseudomonadota bacterium]